jgi:signal transduction histidine kinase
VELADGTTFLPIQQFGLAIAIVGKAKITPDRKFLLQVFLENAALAIRNSEMQSELAEQQQMAAVGQAVAFVLHDLRGPIGVAQMLMQLVRAGDEGYRPKGEMLEIIDGYMKRALDMVGDTLAFSRSHINLKRERVLLASIIEAAVAVSRLDLQRRGIRLDVTVPKELYGYVDSERLDRVLWNLTRNAVDALKGTAAPTIEIGAAATNGGVEVWVSDNGPGVSAEVADKVFKPFSSMKKEGTGFGLAIVKQLVDAHLGRVEMQRRGQTTRFWIFFPDEA